MSSFDGLDVQVANTIVLADRRVSRVRQRAGALVAQPGDVVLVSRKIRQAKPTRAIDRTRKKMRSPVRHREREGKRVRVKERKQEARRRDTRRFKNDNKEPSCT